MTQRSSEATNLRDRGYSSTTDSYKSNTSTTSPQYSSMGLPLNESLSNNNNQKTLSHEGTIDSSDIDYSKIAISADRASSGQFIIDETIYKDLWTDLTYEERPDGTYVIKKGDTKMGFTTKDGFIGYSN